MSLLLFLIVMAAISAAYGWVLRRFGLKGLRCTRRFSRRAVFEGEEGELVEVVSNDRPMLVPWLRVESRMPAGLRFGRQENLEVSGQMYHRSLFTLMPYQRITRRHRVRVTRRGSYNIGNATLTVGDVLGQTQCAAEQHMDVPVLVYPRLLEDDQVPQPASLLLGDLIVEHQLLRDPFLTCGIRGYRAGDPVRDIHWPATARVGSAQVRVHDFTTQARLLVVLNSQLREDQWDNLMDYEQGMVEHAISVAATLCVKMLRAGLTAGFACNMPLEGADERANTIVMPAGGEEQEEALLTAFARLRVLRTRSFNTFLDELPDCAGLDVIILSAYDSEALQEQIVRLRASGANVRLCVLVAGKEAAQDAE